MSSKAISPMIATILLVAFTVAVGGIISVWLTGFTRTQTTTAGAGAACLAANVRIFATPLNSTPTSTVNAYIMNLRSDMNITVTSGVAICGGVVVVNTTPITILGGQSGLLVLNGSTGFSCTTSNTEIRITGNCSTGGSFSASCPVGTCSI